MRSTLLCCAVSARDSLESASARNSDELPSLANASLLHVHRGPLQQATEGRPSASSDVQSPLSLDAATKRPPFTSARLTQHDAAQPSCDPLKPFESVPQQQPYPLRKSLSIDRDPRSRNRGPQLLQKMKRSSSSGSVISKMPNSQPDSLSDTEAAAYQQPTGSLVDTSTIGRGSASSLSSSIFGEPNQWVIDYNDLVSRHPLLYCVPLAHTLARGCECCRSVHPWQVLCLFQYSRLSFVGLHGLRLHACCTPIPLTLTTVCCSHRCCCCHCCCC